MSEEYRAKEAKWHTAANETREIIRLVKATLEKNDEIAGTTLKPRGCRRPGHLTGTPRGPRRTPG